MAQRGLLAAVAFDGFLLVPYRFTPTSDFVARVCETLFGKQWVKVIMYRDGAVYFCRPTAWGFNYKPDYLWAESELWDSERAMTVKALMSVTEYDGWEWAGNQGAVVLNEAFCPLTLHGLIAHASREFILWASDLPEKLFDAACVLTGTTTQRIVSVPGANRQQKCEYVARCSEELWQCTGAPIWRYMFAILAAECAPLVRLMREGDPKTLLLLSEVTGIDREKMLIPL